MSQYRNQLNAAPNAKNTYGHRRRESLENINNKCLIGINCLDDELARTASVCEFLSLQKINAFCANHPILASYPILNQRRIPHRAVMFATEVLGNDNDLTEEQFLRKARIHLFMSVQMTLQWLIDDTLDGNNGLEIAFTELIITYCLDVLALDAQAPMKASLLSAECPQHGIPEAFIEAMTLLIGWQRELAISLSISLHRSSMYSRLNRDFLCSFLRKNDKFSNLKMYLKYRQANCGLSMEIMCGAYWFCCLSGGDPGKLERNMDHYINLIYKYSLLGGVSNDLFGYDKDLEEGIATSVEIVKFTSMARRTSSDAIKTTDAFRLLIKLHNNLLDELMDRIGICNEPLEKSILLACLSTTWAVRMLHYEFKAIYRPGWLQKALSSINLTSGS